MRHRAPHADTVRYSRWLPMAVAALLLAACDGGSGSPTEPLATQAQGAATVSAALPDTDAVQGDDQSAADIGSLVDPVTDTDGPTADAEGTTTSQNDDPAAPPVPAGVQPLPADPDFVEPDPVAPLDPAASVPDRDPLFESSQPSYRDTQILPGGVARLTRVSDNAVFGLQDGAGTHAYSRRPVFNADETLLDVGGRVISASTFEVVGSELPVSSARLWTNTNPDLMVAIASKPLPTVLGYYDVRTEKFVTRRRFDEFSACTFGDGEGTLSNDDARLLVVCRHEEDGPATLISYDVQADWILGRRDARSDFNWASFTPSGDWVVLENNDGAGAGGEELLRCQPDLVACELLSTVRYHGDLGTDDKGRDVFVMLGYDYIGYFRIADGLKVVLPELDALGVLGQGHVSCRNIRRPGWCYVSTYGSSRIAAVRIGRDEERRESFIDSDGQEAVPGSGLAEFQGFHRASGRSYEATARASVSPSGSAIVFASDWYGRGETAAYVLERQER